MPPTTLVLINRVPPAGPEGAPDEILIPESLENDFRRIYQYGLDERLKTTPKTLRNVPGALTALEVGGFIVDEGGKLSIKQTALGYPDMVRIDDKYDSKTNGGDAIGIVHTHPSSTEFDAEDVERFLARSLLVSVIYLANGQAYMLLRTGRTPNSIDVRDVALKSVRNLKLLKIPVFKGLHGVESTKEHTFERFAEIDLLVNQYNLVLYFRVRQGSFKRLPPPE
jgi:hypothetical protein